MRSTCVAQAILKPITAGALTAVLEAAKAGAKVVDVCQLGDDYITECVTSVEAVCQHRHCMVSTGPLPRSTRARPLKRASATQPACPSTSTMPVLSNVQYHHHHTHSCVGAFSPLSDDATELKDGDVVKMCVGLFVTAMHSISMLLHLTTCTACPLLLHLTTLAQHVHCCCTSQLLHSMSTAPAPHSDLGCHIDGFIGTAATTTVVGAIEAAPVTGRAADLLAATETAFEAALRLIRPGKSIADVADVLSTAVESFECVVFWGFGERHHLCLLCFEHIGISSY